MNSVEYSTDYDSEMFTRVVVICKGYLNRVDSRQLCSRGKVSESKGNPGNLDISVY